MDDFASMREVVTAVISACSDEAETFPSLVLIDGGLGQLHAAAQALEALEITNQPLAAIAKREEIIYVHGQEDEAGDYRPAFAGVAPGADGSR